MVRSAGQVSTIGVVTIQLKVVEQEAELPQASVAVHVNILERLHPFMLTIDSVHKVGIGTAPLQRSLATGGGTF